MEQSEFDGKLIDLVRANPLLYEKDIRNTPYELMKKKSELWQSIATSLHVDAKYCVTRWKSLRDKFRRELKNAEELERKTGSSLKKDTRASTWDLLEKMRFLDNHVRHYSTHNAKSPSQQRRASWNDMEAEQLIEQITSEDYPLQEAMDDQNSGEVRSGETVTTITIEPVADDHLFNLKRIETLLDGLDTVNRNHAERRIVAYLCKCQLRVLNNESVDDVVI